MSPFEERRIIVQRSARYYVAGEPGVRIDRIWMLCHGYGQLARDFLNDCGPLARDGVLLVAPEGLSRYYLRGGSGSVGASWMTREDRLAEIEDYVAYLNAVRDGVIAECGAEPAVSVLGFSQGGATAARWAVLGNGSVDRTVLWGATVPESDVEKHADKLRQVGLIMVEGERDPLVNHGERSRSLGAFNRLEIPYTLRSHSGGHELDESILRSLAGGEGERH